MVLFKRKPVQYLPPPHIDNDGIEVWEIKQTGEIFLDYESYLSRMEFYKQRRFICQITGHSGLTFFEALKSELAGGQEVDEAFPEALKGPILRRIQFQTISRIDNLVDLIYEEFRADYYPGESVTVHTTTGERLAGIVRDKSSFGAKVLPDGSIHPPHSRYFVSLDNRPEDEAVVDDAQIFRDRKTFTKQVLRSFIKKTVTREPWNGAPWLVKPELATKYHIDTRIPPHLCFENKNIEKKNKDIQIKNPPEYDGMIGMFRGNLGLDGQTLEYDPVLKSPDYKQQQTHQPIKTQQMPPSVNPVSQVCLSQTSHKSPYISHIFQAVASPTQAIPHSIKFHSSTLTFMPNHSSHKPSHSLPPLVKHSIEDLQVPPRFEGPKRPMLKFLSTDTPNYSHKPECKDNEVLMISVGPLLESWDTLNVYCEVFVLDSFTFDDFVEAMQLSYEEFECQLFIEIHCAALKMLVESEADGGNILVQVPDLLSEGDTEDSAENPLVHLEAEPKPKGRTTRSSLAKAALNSKPRKPHCAAEMESERKWIDRLRKRDFKNGGWQITLIGLLYQLSKNPRYFDKCEVLLKELAPPDLEPTVETARRQYNKLNVNLRIQALQILCALSVETKAIRTYMEECNEEMTTLRKEKIHWQRDRKQCLEKLRTLNEERRIQLPLNAPSSPSENKATITIVDSQESHNSIEDENLDTDQELEQVRSLRRGQDRALQRKRKRQALQEKKAKAMEKSKLPKYTKKFTKLLKDFQKTQDQIIKCESEIETLDNDLREADCPRTRVLGKDRFCNRYYWFERNGMPYGGLPGSSTAHARYANGCIWIQGPDDIEREGFIDMKADLQNDYKEKFGMTVPERKKAEEGSTHLYNAHQWGFYEDPDSIDALISWLDVRGYNEVKLHKELKLYRDRIVSNMENRKKYLNQSKCNSDDFNTKALSTRRKESPHQHRCFGWHNSMALAEIGHLHSDQPRARRPNKKTVATLPDLSEKSNKHEIEKGRFRKPQARLSRK